MLISNEYVSVVSIWNNLRNALVCKFKLNNVGELRYSTCIVIAMITDIAQHLPILLRVYYLKYLTRGRRKKKKQSWQRPVKPLDQWCEYCYSDTGNQHSLRNNIFFHSYHINTETPTVTFFKKRYLQIKKYRYVNNSTHPGTWKEKIQMDRAHRIRR